MNNLIKILAANRGKGVFRAEKSADEATLYLYDVIVDSDAEAEWWGGVSPQSFIKQLNDITAKTIHLRVNSPGGSVFGARAIEQAIREHDATIIAHVDGYAASAASFLIMAADEILMAPGAFLMIHKAWTLAYGNADDLTKTAALLEQIDGSLVKTYAARTGIDAEQIAGMLADETWIDAEEAVKLGFANRIADDAAKNEAPAWDLSAYAKAPAAPAASDAPPPAEDPPPAPEPVPDPQIIAARESAARRLRHYERTQH